MDGEEQGRGCLLVETGTALGIPQTRQDQKAEGHHSPNPSDRREEMEPIGDSQE